MSARLEALARAKALRETDDRVALAGDLARLACADAEDDDALAEAIDEADALLATWAAGTTSLDRRELPDTSSVARWLADPRGPHAKAIAELDELGRIAAGLVSLAPYSEAANEAVAKVATLAAEIGRVARDRSADMLDAAITASERVASHGVFPAADDALLALADVVGDRLDAALRGETLGAEPRLRVRALDVDLARKLGDTLGSALRRTLDVAPDLLELPHVPVASRARDLVLHEATETTEATIELLRGVRITRRDDEIEIELADTPNETPLLVPFVRGEPARPLPSRAGATARHAVFTLGDAEVDGWALVVGDRVAFLRRG